ncbi:hypothetical protein AUC68_02395 [Methyloceanibacter methanicus]|uniref:DUF3137 domain-containing protein n=1 Tax=Methyloceanibacter methanicus TaxID=1774968 RepID=A0A1E3W4A6_9HYPH|nr:hypothetical protein [Methyloceanibacter methanicus]ODR99976.1 hypothetical protein AUC68_02395 [Methyloceanibacter methanicus]
MTILAVITAVAGVAILTYRYREHRNAVRARRAAFFDDCWTVLDDPKLALDAFGYPSLSGTYEGEPIRADVIVDCMGLRKLPSLWLRVTLAAPVRVGAVLDVMMRPSGAEFFSPFSTLPDWLDTPADWPERAVIRTDGPDRFTDPWIFAPHVQFLAEPQAKELIVSPKGARIVWQADEAQRSDYLLLRQARFDVVRFDREKFRELVGRLIHLQRSLAGTPDREERHEAAA